MDYFNDYIGEYLESILLILPTIFIFVSGYYVDHSQYQKNNIILKNIEKFKLDVDHVKSRDYKNLKNEIKKLNDDNEKLLDKIDELSLEIIDKNKIRELEKKEKKIEKNRK